MMTDLKSVLLALSLLSAAAVTARADGMIEITPTAVGTGIEQHLGSCPCFRTVIQVQAAGGRIDTQDVLITRDALLKFAQSQNLGMDTLGSRLVTIGAFDAAAVTDALVKGGHVGVRFSGVEVGEDPDHAYKSVLRAALSALLSVIDNEEARLFLTSGVNFEKSSLVNGATLKRTELQQGAELQFTNGPWKGNVRAYVGFNVNPGNSGYVHAGAGASVRGRVFSFEDFEVGLNANAGVEYDGLRELLGLNPVDGVVSVMADLSWVAVRDHE